MVNFLPWTETNKPNSSVVKSTLTSSVNNSSSNSTMVPIGLQAEVEPIYFNSVMVKRVISEGPTNAYEEKFTFEVLRKQLVQDEKYSCTYV